MRAARRGGDDRPVEVFFHDFKRVGGVLISTRREVTGKNQTVRFDDLQILPETPKGAFDSEAISDATPADARRVARICLLHRDVVRDALTPLTFAASSYAFWRSAALP